MRLTICLITQGRMPYLEEALNSYQPLVAKKYVDVLIIDNGSKNEAKKIINEFHEKFPKKTTIIELENNVTQPSIWLKYIIDMNLDWVIFPGDDDLLLPSILNIFETIKDENPNASAIATKAQIIGKNGEITGETRSYSLNKHDNKLKQIVRSLHQPPFFWPSLIFKASILQRIEIDSRFVFDWAVGLQLVICNEIEFSEDIGIQYRVHPNQESFQTTLNRKYFEASRLIHTVVESEYFIKWIRSLSAAELVEFWEYISNFTPVYGDNKYKLIFLDKFERLILSLLPKEDQIQIVNQWLFMNGVLTKIGDLKSLYLGTGTDQNISNSSNVGIEIIGDCKNLLQFEEFFSLRNSNSMKISCAHSKSSKGSVFIDCNLYVDLEPKFASDLLLNQISMSLENHGIFDFALSPFEKRLIQTFRKYRNKNILRKTRKYFKF